MDEVAAKVIRIIAGHLGIDPAWCCPTLWTLRRWRGVSKTAPMGRVSAVLEFAPNSSCRTSAGPRLSRHRDWSATLGSVRKTFISSGGDREITRWFLTPPP